MTSTNATNIFIPVGEMIFGADYATLKIVINITQIFEETREVCHLSDCLFDLYNNQFAFADKTCDYRIKPSTEAAVRISDSDIFVYSPNTTTLTSKCPELENKSYNKGAAILSLGSGCVFTTTGYLFKRNKKIGE